MDLRSDARSKSRLARTALIAVLAAVAIRWLWQGKRVRGLLAGAGAVALGYNAVSGPTELKHDIGIETTSEESELRCAICGEPIVPGERRRPNDDGDTVHEVCLEATA